MQCPTVRIKSDVLLDNPNGYVVINEEDFDEATMELYKEPKALAPAPTPSAPATAPAHAAAPAPPWTK
jgi:hypothetical protein